MLKIEKSGETIAKCVLAKAVASSPSYKETLLRQLKKGDRLRTKGRDKSVKLVLGKGNALIRGK